MIQLDPAVAPAAGPAAFATGFMDPLFWVALVGSLGFLWMLIRFLLDGFDLGGRLDTEEESGGPGHRPGGRTPGGAGFRPDHPADHRRRPAA